MNFFDAQDQARRSSRRLVRLYLLSASLIVTATSFLVSYGYAFLRNVQPDLTYSNTSVFVTTAFVTTLLMLGATMFKTRQMKSGGGCVAAQLGGVRVEPGTIDPLHLRLRNVVEEMAIASGVPVPEIYVLEQETGINAFAAGFAPGDAAIAVTRGTLKMLDRDELQGVIGHEFSHILNGDMRLNIRLIGVLFGILALSITGRKMLRGMRHVRLGSSREKGAGAIVAVIFIMGVGLTIIGSIGVFFARIIKSGVSRQREFLADASAVQFTRQTSGIANALKKIGGYRAGSHIENADPEEVSHMLFSTGSKLAGIFATHPPLTERIQALDPSFEEGDYAPVRASDRKVGASIYAEESQAGFAAATAEAATAPVANIAPESITASVAQPTDEHLAFASHLRQTVPVLLYDAAHSTESSYLLAVALILDRSGHTLDRQYSMIDDFLGKQRCSMVRRLFDELHKIGPEYRLPLLDIAFPALRQRPTAELEYLIDLTGRLIEIDGQIELHEFCFYRVLASNLRHIMNPSKGQPQRRANRKSVRDATVSLLRIIARYGHEDDADGEAAFRAGLAIFGNWGASYRYETESIKTTADLELSLDQLVALDGKGRQMLLNSVSCTVLHDDELTLPEAELVRVICASLEIPLPPQIGVSLNS